MTRWLFVCECGITFTVRTEHDQPPPERRCRVCDRFVIGQRRPPEVWVMPQREK